MARTVQGALHSETSRGDNSWFPGVVGARRTMSGKLQSRRVHIPITILLVIASAEEQQSSANCDSLGTTPNLRGNSTRKGAAPHHVVDIQGNHVIKTSSRLASGKSASSENLETVTNK